MLVYEVEILLSEMLRLSVELRRLVVTLHQNGDSVADILNQLRDGRVTVSYTALYKEIQRMWNCSRPQKSNNTSQANSGTLAVLRQCSCGK